MNLKGEHPTPFLPVKLKKSFYKTKKYPHFGSRISPQNALKIARNRLYVKKHAFYPFLKFSKYSVKFSVENDNSKPTKKKPKEREIFYSSHLDSYIYSYYAKILSDNYEEKVKNENIDECVLAFRELGLSNANFALKAFKKIKDMTDCFVLTLDIKNFFDTIDHSILKNKLIEILNLDSNVSNKKLPDDYFNIFKSITKYSFIKKNDLFELKNISKNKKNLNRLLKPKEFRELIKNNSNILQNNKNTFGIPQGSPISAVLSNIYMLDFDIFFRKFSKRKSCFYYRYCDDIIFICDIKNKIDSIKKLFERKINKIRLEINENKTLICKFEKGEISKDTIPLQYLGFIYDGNRVTLRSSSISRYLHKMKRGVKNLKRSNESINLKRLNQNKKGIGLFKKSIYKRYSYLGKRNFISYALKASKIMSEIDSKNSIKKQIKPFWNKLKKEIEK